MQNARLPYRVGYTAFAASASMARLGRQRSIIRAAQRVRGGRMRRGPIAAIARELDTATALLIDALRHSERMALALESRSFGAYEQRTWRRVVRWTWTDTWYIVVAVAATVVAATATAIIG